jgi:hypothetical protein
MSHWETRLRGCYVELSMYVRVIPINHNCSTKILGLLIMETVVSPEATYELPCDLCRRRKVRCSKTLPCQSCKQNGADCSYDDQSRRKTPRNAELSHRLARLESLVKHSSRQMPMKDTPDVSQAATSSTGDFDLIRETPLLSMERPGKLGQLSFVLGRSRYVQIGFWAGMYEEVLDPYISELAKPDWMTRLKVSNIL